MALAGCTVRIPGGHWKWTIHFWWLTNDGLCAASLNLFLWTAWLTTAGTGECVIWKDFFFSIPPTCSLPFLGHATLLMEVMLAVVLGEVLCHGTVMLHILTPVCFRTVSISISDLDRAVFMAPLQQDTAEALEGPRHCGLCAQYMALPWHSVQLLGCVYTHTNT